LDLSDASMNGHAMPANKGLRHGFFKDYVVVLKSTKSFLATTGKRSTCNGCFLLILSGFILLISTTKDFLVAFV
jgi:hypothetical protein